jgi:hypothetical protein
MGIDRSDAEEFSQSLEQIGEGWFRQLALGIKLGAPEALGLTRREWSDRIGLTVRTATERRDAVTELTAEGLSNRAIADVLGVSDMTVGRDLGNATNVAPDEESPAHESEGATNVAVVPIDDKKAIAYIYKKNCAADLEQSRADRIDNIAEIAKGNAALDLSQQFPVILADPPWRYENPPMGGGKR